MSLYARQRLLHVIAFMISCCAVAPVRAADPATQASTKPAQTASLPGTIEPLEQADLYAKVAGYVIEVQADIGDHVKAGQPLAVIENPELESEVAAADATLRAKREMANAAGLDRPSKDHAAGRSKPVGRLPGGPEARAVDFETAGRALRREGDNGSAAR